MGNSRGNWGNSTVMEKGKDHERTVVPGLWKNWNLGKKTAGCRLSVSALEVSA